MGHALSATINKNIKFTFGWINSKSVNHIELKYLLKIIQLSSQQKISILKWCF